MMRLVKRLLTLAFLANAIPLAFSNWAGTVGVAPSPSGEALSVVVENVVVHDKALTSDDVKTNGFVRNLRDQNRRPGITGLNPPEQGFFAKTLSFHGIPIKAHHVVADEALVAAYERLSQLLGHQPMVISNLVTAGAALHIIGRHQVTTDLPEWRQDKGKPLAEYGGLTRDQRTRGMGGLISSCGEENLLKLEEDRYQGRDICLHEFSHCVRNYGIPAEVRARFDAQYRRSLEKGLWLNSYAASNPDEFFAELTMWYFGTHGDRQMSGPIPGNGPEGLKTYDREAFELFDEFYSGRMSVVGAKAPTPNLVRVVGNSLCDDAGPFLGLGASYMQALRDAKYDRARLQENLALLVSNGFNYVRILSMVSWEGFEIAPVAFTNRLGRVVPAWPDYWQLFRDLLESAGQHGLRVEITIFADAQYVMPSRSERQAHVDRILANIAGREHQVIYLEVANEAWQNGFPGGQGILDLRSLTQHLADRTPVLVAITSPHDYLTESIISLYRGSAADLATVHFSRDTRTAEGAWLPVHDSYRAGKLPGVPPVISNEPIGPGSSVASEADPIKLCSAAVFAYLANLPGYIFHSRTGIYGYEKCCPPAGDRLRFADTSGIEAFRHLRRLLPPDLASWTRNDGIEPSAPFTIFCNDQPNQYWPAVKDPANGCIRNIGASKGSEFVCFPMGILAGGVTLEARGAVQVEVYNPLTGGVVTNLTLNASSAFSLPQGPGAYIIKGSSAK